jgi:hypothetical protein
MVYKELKAFMRLFRTLALCLIVLSGCNNQSIGDFINDQTGEVRLKLTPDGQFIGAIDTAMGGMESSRFRINPLPSVTVYVVLENSQGYDLRLVLASSGSPIGTAALQSPTPSNDDANYLTVIGSPRGEDEYLVGIDITGADRGDAYNLVLQVSIPGQSRAFDDIPLPLIYCPMALMNSTYYAKLQDAINASTASPDSITLLGDITILGGITIPAGKSIKLLAGDAVVNFANGKFTTTHGHFIEL